MIINADKTNLKNLLGVPDRQLRIPPYQRPYAWEADQIDELWHDIVDSLDGSHFMGSIVLCSPDDLRPEVIDGQQRLTTILTFLCLIRDRYQEHKPELIGRIQQFLENSYAESDLVFKFRPGKANKRFFTEFILRSPEDEARRDWDQINDLDSHEKNRNSNLISNAKRLAKYLDNFLEASADPLATLEKLEKNIMTNLEFVVIDVPDVANAFIIFETLNDRGLALSAGDLLKNHLLAAAAKDNESIEDLSAEWDVIVSSLENSDITRFLRHYLLTTNAKVQKDDVFPLFKKAVSKSGVRPLVTVLRQMAGLYGQFVKPELVSDKSLRVVYENLNTLRATMCYSSLLAASSVLEGEDLVGFAHLCELLTFRYSTICSKDSKELERYYHLAAKELVTNGSEGLEKAREILLSVMPNSEEFQIAFKGQFMGRHYLVNYTFRHIENYLDPEEKILDDTQKVHIEHIMPQTLSDEWRSDLGQEAEEHEEFVNRWGNLTLLGGRKNIVASNHAFSKKCEIYAESKIAMSRELDEHESWGLREIEERQVKLAQIADVVWSV